MFLTKEIAALFFGGRANLRICSPIALKSLALSAGMWQSTKTKLQNKKHILNSLLVNLADVAHFISYCACNILYKYCAQNSV